MIFKNHVNFMKMGLNSVKLTMATKKRRIFRTTFASVNLFNLGFFYLSPESVSNLRFISERFIQIGEWSEEQQPYY